MTRSESKSVIVTGSGRGIGRAIALRLARDGFSVLVNDFDVEPGAEVVTEIQNAGGIAIANNADVTDEDQVRVMVEQATSEFGQVDVMIANAGIGKQIFREEGILCTRCCRHGYSVDTDPHLKPRHHLFGK